MDIEQIQEAGNQARGTTHQFNAEVMESRISDLEAAVAQMWDQLLAISSMAQNAKAAPTKSSRSSVGNLDAGHV